MQVKILRSVVADGAPRYVGEVIDLPANDAFALVQSGAAERVEGAQGAKGSMRVRLTRAADVAGVPHKVGDEIDLDDKTALALLRSGVAVEVTAQPQNTGQKQQATDTEAKRAEKRGKAE
jgi:hypothetical protein